MIRKGGDGREASGLCAAVSKAEKRRAKEREREQRTLAERLARGGEVRVLNAGRMAGNGTSSRGQNLHANMHPPTAFPTLSYATFFGVVFCAYHVFHPAAV